MYFVFFFLLLTGRHVFQIGEFTFFAPTDGAFELLLKGQEDFLIFNSHFRTTLLLRHFVRTKLSKGYWTKLSSDVITKITMADGSIIDLSRTGNCSSLIGSYTYFKSPLFGVCSYLCCLFCCS